MTCNEKLEQWKRLLRDFQDWIDSGYRGVPEAFLGSTIDGDAVGRQLEQRRLEEGVKCSGMIPLMVEECNGMCHVVLFGREKEGIRMLIALGSMGCGWGAQGLMHDRETPGLLCVEPRGCLNIREAVGLTDRLQKGVLQNRVPKFGRAATSCEFNVLLLRLPLGKERRTMNEICRTLS